MSLSNIYFESMRIFDKAFKAGYNASVFGRLAQLVRALR